MRSNRDATIFQSIGPSFVLTFPDRGCARIKPRRRIPFDSSAHYYSLLGPITLPLSLVAVPFHSLFFHLSPLRFFTVERAKRSKIDRRSPWKERRAFSFLISQRYNRIIPRFPYFSLFRTDVEKVFWRKHGGSMLNGSGKIFERGKFGLRLFFCFLHILCGWI